MQTRLPSYLTVTEEGLEKLLSQFFYLKVVSEVLGLGQTLNFS